MKEQVKSSIAKMRKYVDDFPQLLTSLPLGKTMLERCHEVSETGIQGICLIGMGGSSIANQYTISLLKDKSKIPIISVQDYAPPAQVNKDYVVIAVSYSGNTEETLSATTNAKLRHCELMAITSGGRLAKTVSAKEALPSDIPPRAAMPLMFCKVLPMVEALCGLPVTDFSQVQTRLLEYKDTWHSTTALAQRINERLPLFVGSGIMIPVAYRAKCQVNENAKSEAFFSHLPEANHNELEGFRKDRARTIQPVILRSSFERPEMKKRMNVTTDILDEMGYDCVALHAPADGTSMEQMMALTHYLDTVSLDLAELNGVDPINVARIELLKQKLA